MASDKDHVEINIEETAKEGDSKPVTPPIVPEVSTLGNQEVKPPKTSTTGRGRQQLKPSGGTTSRSRSGSRSPGRRTRRDTTSAQNDAIPLLPMDEGGRQPRPRPPIADQEQDDESDDRLNFDSADSASGAGVDDGLWPGKQNDIGREVGRRSPGRRNSLPPNQPFGPIGPMGPPVAHPLDREIPDVNVYQQKKNLAQGMMDLALLSANANQLRYVLESYSRHPYFYFSLVFISTSIICQVAVGIGLIMKSRYNIKRDEDFCKADRLNNMITIGIFLITLVNVLISAFGVAEPSKQSAV
ncbi:ninjurin-A-like [Uranotaenia lowii]|uniref:ninjurin-A-like n=1 Tax=Uranotaenia lowii TaxID=190385 RepID=UPI002478D747|nr:ninjurin-A-like [Uranotaenia lowii]